LKAATRANLKLLACCLVLLAVCMAPVPSVISWVIRHARSTIALVKPGMTEAEVARALGRRPAWRGNDEVALREVAHRNFGLDALTGRDGPGCSQFSTTKRAVLQIEHVRLRGHRAAIYPAGWIPTSFVALVFFDAGGRVVCVLTGSS
jgi:hypothetical protein